mmetsp:Transcript_40974/g.96278  ORF Transcript_40974/g.96278 Transcript_40974/m.96278 type:complete len:210 (+) Transcript_40974:3328-3957(+)
MLAVLGDEPPVLRGDSDEPQDIWMVKSSCKLQRRHRFNFVKESIGPDTKFCNLRSDFRIPTSVLPRGLVDLSESTLAYGLHHLQLFSAHLLIARHACQSYQRCRRKGMLTFFSFSSGQHLERNCLFRRARMPESWIALRLSESTFIGRQSMNFGHQSSLAATSKHQGTFCTKNCCEGDKEGCNTNDYAHGVIAAAFLAGSSCCTNAAVC